MLISSLMSCVQPAGLRHTTCQTAGTPSLRHCGASEQDTAVLCLNNRAQKWTKKPASIWAHNIMIHCLYAVIDTDIYRFVIIAWSLKSKSLTI